MTQPVRGETDAVLVLAPRGRDALLTRDLLVREGIRAEICDDVSDVCRRIEAGAIAALIAEEAMVHGASQNIRAVLARQPAWSDFPLIFFGATRTDADVEAVDDELLTMGNVTVLDRPVRVRSMITAVHAAVRARMRQYEGRRAIESRDQFLAMLGHELRNPLSVIQLAADLLRRTDDAVQRERQRAAVERQARHLARLVDDLLDVARVAHGKVTLQRAETDVGEVLAACCQAIEHAADANELEVELSVEAGLRIDGDRIRLEQIFGNLLTNAIKYTPCGGSIRVEARREGKHAVVRVIDSGIGIDAPMLPHVFDLFAQADRSLDRARGGMGLGLTLVRTLVRLHGGDVEAASGGLGSGSEFRVRLPLLLDDAARGTKAVAEPSVAKAKRVVLVEDSEDIRSLLATLLRLAGHEVWTAGDGPAGVTRILEARPHLALVDIGLPGFDGYEVARRVRAELGPQVRLVAITGYGQSEYRSRALAAGFDQYLTKPIGTEVLERIIAQPATAS